MKKREILFSFWFFFVFPKKSQEPLREKANSCHHLNLTNSSIIREQQLQRPRLAVYRNSQQPFRFPPKKLGHFFGAKFEFFFTAERFRSKMKKESWLCENFVWPPTPYFERIAEILILPANKMNRHVQIVTCGLFCWKKLLLLWFWTNHLSVLVADCNWCGRIIQFPCCCCYVECV